MPSCIGTHNITRNFTLQEPQGKSSSKDVEFPTMVLITLDSIPPECNLLLAGVSVMASHACDITLALVDKINMQQYSVSSSANITRQRPHQQQPGISQLDFSITDHKLNSTLNMVLRVPGTSSNCSIMVRDGMSLPGLRTKTDMGPLKVAGNTDLAPVITYQFRGK